MPQDIAPPFHRARTPELAIFLGSGFLRLSDEESGNTDGMVFIVPRGRDRIVLGGLTEADEWTTDINLENYAPIQRMYDRCIEFLPSLRSAVIDTAEPVRVGLRPTRPENVRLEWETGMPVIHCYGHGGSGVTLSWGCAEEIASMVTRTKASVNV